MTKGEQVRLVAWRRRMLRHAEDGVGTPLALSTLYDCVPLSANSPVAAVNPRVAGSNPARGAKILV